MCEVDWKLLGFQREMLRIMRLQEREKRGSEFCCYLDRSKNENFQFHYNMDGRKINRFLLNLMCIVIHCTMWIRKTN